jgi:hypothetical protein
MLQALLYCYIPASQQNGLRSHHCPCRLLWYFWKKRENLNFSLSLVDVLSCIVAG